MAGAEKRVRGDNRSRAADTTYVMSVPSYTSLTVHIDVAIFPIGIGARGEKEVVESCVAGGDVAVSDYGMYVGVERIRFSDGIGAVSGG